MAENGTTFIVKVSADGGTTWLAVAGATEAQCKRKAATIDSTSKDSGGNAQTDAGLRSWELTSDHLLVKADAGQKALEAAYAAGEKVKVELIEDDSAATPTDVLTGLAVITELDLDAKLEAAVTFTVTLTGDGPLTAAGDAI